MAGSGQFKAVHNEWDIACKVWVGGLGEEGTRLELEESFNKFGPVKNIWLAKNPPSFAFIEMEVMWHFTCMLSVIPDKLTPYFQKKIKNQITDASLPQVILILYWIVNHMFVVGP